MPPMKGQNDHAQRNTGNHTDCHAWDAYDAILVIDLVEHVQLWGFITGQVTPENPK